MNTNEIKENVLLTSDNKVKKIIKKTKIIRKTIKRKSSNVTPYKEDPISNLDTCTNESTPKATETKRSFDVTMASNSRKESDTVEVDATYDEINVTLDGDERLQYDRPFENSENKCITLIREEDTANLLPVSSLSLSEFSKLNILDEEIRENLEYQERLQEKLQIIIENLSEEKLLEKKYVQEDSEHTSNNEVLVPENLESEHNIVRIWENNDDNFDVQVDNTESKKENDKIEEDVRKTVYVCRIDATNTSEDTSNIPHHIDPHDSVKSDDEVFEIKDNCFLYAPINSCDIKDHIIENRLDLNENNMHIPIDIKDIIIPEVKIDIMQDTSLNIEKLNNGESMLNNDIIADMTENAVEALTASSRDNNINKIFENGVDEEVLKADNAVEVKDFFAVSNEIGDKIISISTSPADNSDLILIKDVDTERIDQDANKYSEIIPVLKFEENEDKKIKKFNEKSNFRNFLEKYPSYIFLSIGGFVMSYFIYRRFSRYYK